MHVEAQSKSVPAILKRLRIAESFGCRACISIIYIVSKCSEIVHACSAVTVVSTMHCHTYAGSNTAAISCRPFLPIEVQEILRICVRLILVEKLHL